VQEELIKLLVGRRGHFQMESGYHSDAWFQLDRLFAEPARLQPFVSELGRRIASHRPQAICGPKVGGARLAEAIAAELGITFFFTERVETLDATGLFPIKYELPAAARSKIAGLAVAIVDDAISAGSAVRGTLASLVNHGARPIALGALFVFGDKAARFAMEKELPLESIAQVQFNIWPPTACPLCRARQPVEKVSDQ
jgi:orotate phosphoribosyltransferase